MDISSIKTQRDCRKVLKEIEGLTIAKRNTPEGNRLDVLVTLVEAWERKHYPMDLPDPVGSEWAAASRSHSVHRQSQLRARGAKSKALAYAQNDLATA
jgi:antitoxin component HigA of HigAB toxin-antitoxin module